MARSHANATFQNQPQGALRLMLSYGGLEIRQDSQRLVQMIAPPSDRLDEYENESGFWIELHDEQDRVLYRRVMRNPMELEREVPSGDPQHPFTHVPRERAEGTFSVVVPYFEAARTLVIFASPAGDLRASAKPVTRIELGSPPKSDKKENR